MTVLPKFAELSRILLRKEIIIKFAKQPSFHNVMKGMLVRVAEDELHRVTVIEGVEAGEKGVLLRLKNVADLVQIDAISNDPFTEKEITAWQSDSSASSVTVQFIQSKMAEIQKFVNDLKAKTPRAQSPEEQAPKRPKVEQQANPPSTQPIATQSPTAQIDRSVDAATIANLEQQIKTLTETVASLTQEVAAVKEASIKSSQKASEEVEDANQKLVALRIEMQRQITTLEEEVSIRGSALTNAAANLRSVAQGVATSREESDKHSQLLREELEKSVKSAVEVSALISSRFAKVESDLRSAVSSFGGTPTVSQ